MAMNKRGIGVVGVIVVLVLIVAAYFILIRPAATGTLQVKITDAAENITALNLDISRIDVHMAGTETNATTGNETSGEETNDTSTAGWTTVVQGPKTIDLIQVKGVTDLLGETALQPGKYTQIRVYVTSATATINGQTQTLKIPSGAIKFIHPFTIVANQTTSLIIDFNADRSIVETGNGTFIFKPVVALVTEFTAVGRDIANQKMAEQAAERAKGHKP